MWSRLPSRFVARMLTGHAALGLAASALLYILCLSGTLMVFHEEFARWEQPAAPEFERAAPEAVHRAALDVLDRLEEPPHHFFLGLPVAGMPRLTVTADERGWYADARGEIVGPVRHEWTHFLEKLHYYLTLPGVLGLTLVGILGMLMTGLIFSGLLAHPRLFRDAFRLRLSNSEGVRRADIHNRLSVWGAPFYLMIAFTGAALGLATLLGVSITAMRGDVDTAGFFAAVFGAEAEGDKQAAPLSDIATALHGFDKRYPDLVPWYVSFHDPATAGQSAEILAKHPRRLIYGDNYRFDDEGALTGNLGLSDGAPGKQIVASVYPLHFGSFGGLPVKLAYGILGLLACVVVVSGIDLWLVKRRQRGQPSPMLERAWQAIVWGTPAVLALVLLAETAGLESVNWLVALFWTVLLLFVVLAMVSSRRQPAPLLRIATAVLVFAALATQHALHLGDFISPAARGVSLSLLILAGWLFFSARLYRARLGYVFFACLARKRSRLSAKAFRSL